MKFKYIAKTKTWETEEGLIVAPNLEEAKLLLSNKDLTLVSIKPVKKALELSFSNTFLGRVSFLEKILFAKNLSLMIQAGLPLRESVVTIQEQSRSRKLKRVLDDALKSIDNGQSLAESLSYHSRIFNNFYINMIRIGEESGTLKENLEHLASQLEKNRDIRQRVKGAMLYPLIVFTTLILLSLGLIFFVLPKILPVFKALQVQLPLTTRILIRFTDITQNYGLYIFFGIVVIVIILFLMSRKKQVKFLIQKINFKIPIMGRILQDVNLAHFSRTLGTLLTSGLPVIRALEITRDTLGNLIYQKETEGMTEAIKQGKTISDYLGPKKTTFPPMVSRMIGAGEKTGNLGGTLLYLGQFYEEEMDRSIRTLSSVIEPILLIIIGIGIGFISLAIISPIYEITRGLHI
ncbi:MAG: type II secretion system F family protein [Candidatus Bathyarchaeota archaeon]|nr:type II secretion system F family protein [Candidatus Bathyarchaeota archaeon]